MSRPVQSGKTSLLLQWAAGRAGIAGILTPDISGRRILRDITSGIDYRLELKSGESNEGTEIVAIGRFHFAAAAFQDARNLLMEAAGKNPDWLIVDEVGKLELERNEGLEPAVSALVSLYKSDTPRGKLLLVIRDHLLVQAKEHWGLDGAIVVNDPADLPVDTPATIEQETGNRKQETGNSLFGLVLCGGKSTRMGQDKSLLVYRGAPQRYYLYGLLKTVCEEVFISCNSRQLKDIPSSFNTIEDSGKFGDIGPMCGLLSAFDIHPQASFLVVGCDYPLLGKEDLQLLKETFYKTGNSLAYFNRETKFTEPLLATYHSSIRSLLITNFNKGRYSLRRLLEEAHIPLIEPRDPSHLRSVDSFEEYQAMVKDLADKRPRL